jgi:EpsI family protein
MTTRNDHPALQRPAAPTMQRRAVLLGGLMAAGMAAAQTLEPRRRLADELPPLNLESQIPKTFGRWTMDTTVVPVLPNPQLQATLDAVYTQVLARSYIDGTTGERLMLSVAYGSDQGSEATAVHRPEFCYSTQGFRVQTVRDDQIDLSTHRIPARRLVARLGERIEPITYWVTLDSHVSLPGFARKVDQIRFGLQGKIPDGMLFRISNITRTGPDASFKTHDLFATTLSSLMPPNQRSRYFGA